MRTSLKFLQSKDEDFENYLNLIVSARVPQAFLDRAARQGVKFEQDPERAWLWRSKVGFQSVVIVACIELPVEERYYN